MASFIPQQPWLRRLTYELIYAMPTFAKAAAFNRGSSPARADIC